jgi:hypothetical protein
VVARLRRDGNYLSRNGRKLVGSLWLGDRQPGSILLRLLRKGGKQETVDCHDLVRSGQELVFAASPSPFAPKPARRMGHPAIRKLAGS